MTSKLKCKHLSWHRNGISGEGFFVGLFDDKEMGQEMVVIRFPGKEIRTAVLSVNLLAKPGDTPETRIGMARGNSWRGDYYEKPMLTAIRAYYREEAKKWGWGTGKETTTQFVARMLKEFLNP